MICLKRNTGVITTLILTVALAIQLTPVRRVRAADHVDAPGVIQDRGADLGDVFAFLDPNDNSRVILALDVQNFIIPGEVTTQVTFDHNLLYRFEIENTGDAVTDLTIDVTFSRKVMELTSQTATVNLPGRRSFTAPTTPESIDSAPNAPIITTDAASGVTFFAGETDDPFFFDVPAFKRFARSAMQNPGHPDPSFFQRGRDTYAGYDTLMIVLSLPATMLRGSSNMIGVQALTMRNKNLKITGDGDVQGHGAFRQVDRVGIPGVNPDIIPFPRKDEYNASSPEDDAAGKFTADITTVLKTLGTDDAHINMFLDLAQRKGDLLRLDLSVPNSGQQGGTNAAAGFPNGRRPADDVIRVALTLLNNGNPLDDNVPANDEVFRNTFPFFAAPQQPRPPGTIDDNTRN